MRCTRDPIARLPLTEAGRVEELRAVRGCSAVSKEGHIPGPENVWKGCNEVGSRRTDESKIIVAGRGRRRCGGTDARN
jgi:hypothetical protein